MLSAGTIQDPCQIALAGPLVAEKIKNFARFALKAFTKRRPCFKLFRKEISRVAQRNPQFPTCFPYLEKGCVKGCLSEFVSPRGRRPSSRFSYEVFDRESFSDITCLSKVRVGLPASLLRDSTRHRRPRRSARPP